MKQTESPAIRAIQEIKKAVIGKDDCIIKVMTAILAGGHILIEDVPGVGKTTLALAFSKALHLEQNRIQFTPDVLPGDVTGFSLYQKATGTFEYQPGLLCVTCFWRMRSTVLHRRRRRHFWKSWRKGK